MREHHPDHESEHQASHPPPENVSALLVELREHVPFSVSSVAVGLVVAGTLCILASVFTGDVPSDAAPPEAQHAHVGEGAAGTDHVHDEHEAAGHAADDDGHGHEMTLGRLFFHLFHPVHMLFSAAATTAMFWRYERKMLKAILIGLIGATCVCGLSDIAMPHAALLILGTHTEMHICIIEHPGLVLPFAAVGVLMGLWAGGGVQKATLVYHSMHVFASTMASIFYMAGPLGLVAWIDGIGKMFLFVIPAVMVPCCLSDIVFPMLMLKPHRERYFSQPHVH